MCAMNWRRSGQSYRQCTHPATSVTIVQPRIAKDTKRDSRRVSYQPLKKQGRQSASQRSIEGRNEINGGALTGVRHGTQKTAEGTSWQVTLSGETTTSKNETRRVLRPYLSLWCLVLVNQQVARQSMWLDRVSGRPNYEGDACEGLRETRAVTYRRPLVHINIKEYFTYGFNVGIWII